QPNSTWRNIFDWHTRALGLPPIAALDEAESQRWKVFYRGQSATPLIVRAMRETRQWLQLLPKSFVRECFWAKQFGLSLLARFQLNTLERRALLAQSKAGTPVRVGERAAPEPFFLSDAAPGPQLNYHWAVSGIDARGMAEWYHRYSSPDSILNWETVCAAGDAASAESDGTESPIPQASPPGHVRL